MQRPDTRADQDQNAEDRAAANAQSLARLVRSALNQPCSSSRPETAPSAGRRKKRTPRTSKATPKTAARIAPTVGVNRPRSKLQYSIHKLAQRVSSRTSRTPRRPTKMPARTPVAVLRPQEADAEHDQPDRARPAGAGRDQRPTALPCQPTALPQRRRRGRRRFRACPARTAVPARLATAMRSSRLEERDFRRVLDGHGHGNSCPEKSWRQGRPATVPVRRLLAASLNSGTKQGRSDSNAQPRFWRPVLYQLSYTPSSRGQRRPIEQRQRTLDYSLAFH